MTALAELSPVQVVAEATDELRVLRVPLLGMQRQLHRVKDMLKEVRFYSAPSALIGGWHGPSALTEAPDVLTPAAWGVTVSTRLLQCVPLQHTTTMGGGGGTLLHSSQVPIGSPRPTTPSDNCFVLREHATATANMAPSAMLDSAEQRAVESNIAADLCDSPRTILLDGERLTFKPSSVPNYPRGLRYSKGRLPALFVDWYESAHVVIEGRGIPLRAFPLVYSIRAGFKRNAWKSHRSTYNNWKVSIGSVS